MNFQTIITIIVVTSIVILIYQHIFPPEIKHIHHHNNVHIKNEKKIVSNPPVYIGEHTSAHSNTIVATPYKPLDLKNNPIYNIHDG